MPKEELAALAREKGFLGEIQPTVKKAFDRAKELAKTEDMIFIGGSTFTVAEIL